MSRSPFEITLLSDAVDTAPRQLILAARRNVITRLCSAGLVVVAALPVLPLQHISFWILLAISHLTLELSLTSPRWIALPNSSRIPISWACVALFGGAVNAAGAALFWQVNLPTARLFAIVMVCVSLLYHMMQYYSRPKIILLLSLPQLTVTVIGAGSVIRDHFQHHAPWLTITTIVCVIYLFNFISNARSALAISREKLIGARALAQEQTAAADTANIAKSAFLATMSHEIRTPLNGVLEMAQAMAAEDLPDSQRAKLNVIRHSGETLLTILNDILDLSKIEAGKLELEDVDFNLSDLARTCHASFTALASEKGIVFPLTIEPGARGVYRSDSTRIRQILSNLISNALKFTNHGQVSVAIMSYAPGLRITVTDTGIGIPADRLDKLFKKFEQADASTTRRYGGTGLGLAICRELAELLRGKISVQSTEGVGTTFIVELPIMRIGEEREVMEGEAGPVLVRVDTLRVLAAEDNSVNRLVLKTLLNQAGIDPVIVSDGAQAVKAFKERAWDIILMDVQMPEMDGPSASRVIRTIERDQKRARTPILALTANAMSHQIADYKTAGMNGFVAKPISVDQLFCAIEDALEASDYASVAAAAG